MKINSNLLQALLLALSLPTCASAQVASVPPPPLPAAVFAVQTNNTLSVAEARQQFLNYRKDMGYQQAGRDIDSKSGYFDLNISTLKAMYDEATARGWTDIRVYNGVNKSGSRTFLMNGIIVNGSRIEEASKNDTDSVAEVENPSVAGGTDCPRWCDVRNTIIGRN